jgi:hypothetical protein
MSKNKKTTTIKWNSNSEKTDFKANQEKLAKEQKILQHRCAKKTKHTHFSVFFFIIAFVIATLITYLSYDKNIPTNTKQPSHIISNTAEFETIKTDILKQKKLTKYVPTKQTSKEHSSNNIAYIGNKYTAILKRGKIFITNTKNNAFVSATEISPTALNDNNAINYYNIFAFDDKLITTGYRNNTKTLEVSYFSITKDGALTRDNSYNLPSRPLANDTILIDNHLIFYTTTNLSDVSNYSNISPIGQFDIETKTFITQPIPDKNTQIIYDANISPANPIIHTVTICPLDTTLNIQNCTQHNIIDNDNATLTIKDHSLQLATSQHKKIYSLTPAFPYTKNYSIPINSNNVAITFINHSQQDINNDNISTDDNIMSSINITPDKKLIIYENQNTIFAKAFIDNNPTSDKHIFSNAFTRTPFSKINSTQSSQVSNVLSLKDTTDISNIQTQIHSFNFNNQTLISVTTVDEIKGSGTIDLLQLDRDKLKNLYSLPFTKASQNTNDNCHNDCTQDWKILNQFFNNPLNNSLYALTGSYLKQFTYNDTQNIALAKTINYTHKPIPKISRKLSEYPIGAKVENGKYICKKHHKEYVGKSKKNNKGYYHLDRECCLDPDEYPNPWCTYRPGELSVTNLKYKDYTGKKVKLKKH